MAGKFFDEWQVGDTLTHEIHRTVTDGQDGPRLADEAVTPRS